MPVRNLSFTSEMGFTDIEFPTIDLTRGGYRDALQGESSLIIGENINCLLPCIEGGAKIKVNGAERLHYSLSVVEKLGYPITSIVSVPPGFITPNDTWDRRYFRKTLNLDRARVVDILLVADVNQPPILEITWWTAPLAQDGQMGADAKNEVDAASEARRADWQVVPINLATADGVAFLVYKVRQ